MDAKSGDQACLIVDDQRQQQRRADDISMRECDVRYNAVCGWIRSIEAQTQKQIEAQDRRLNDRIDALDRRMSEKIDGVEGHVVSRIDRIEQTMRNGFDEIKTTILKIFLAFLSPIAVVAVYSLVRWNGG